VEDDTTFQQKLKNLLYFRFPSRVFREAANGKEAFETMGSVRFTLVFMSIKLAGENGLELANKIKDQHPEIFVIILSGTVQESARKGKETLHDLETDGHALLEPTKRLLNLRIRPRR
jgi:DNA-binding NarL/FixJ family response regulator